MNLWIAFLSLICLLVCNFSHWYKMDDRIDRGGQATASNTDGYIIILTISLYNDI